MRNIVLIGGIALVVLFGWSVYMRDNDPALIAHNGLHWHAQLTMRVGTTTIPVPAGIGLRGTEMAVHTHDTSGQIHMEFSGPVHRDDLLLERVFEEWDHPMESFGSHMTMRVNGATSTEFGSYMMHDGDEIELDYE